MLDPSNMQIRREVPVASAVLDPFQYASSGCTPATQFGRAEFVNCVSPCVV